MVGEEGTGKGEVVTWGELGGNANITFWEGDHEDDDDTLLSWLHQLGILWIVLNFIIKKVKDYCSYNNNVISDNSFPSLATKNKGCCPMNGLSKTGYGYF